MAAAGRHPFHSTRDSLVVSMRLEDQVCSLELAKRLKELGVNQESLYEWVERWGDKTCGIFPSDNDIVNTKWSAFTVAELGEMLLPDIYSYKTPDGSWVCARKSPTYLVDAETEADARAKLLIYLIEQGLVKP